MNAEWRWDFAIEILPQMLWATLNTILAAGIGYAIAAMAYPIPAAIIVFKVAHNICGNISKAKSHLHSAFILGLTFPNLFCS